MLPNQLSAAQFRHYPPQAQVLAVRHLPLLRQLPLAFLASFLREVIDDDYNFPAERAELREQFSSLEALSGPEIKEWFAPFSRLRLSSALQSSNWIDQPLSFTEQLSAYLWSTDQMDKFHHAATQYVTRLGGLRAPAPPSMPRLGIAIIGQGVASDSTSLFRQLRAHGTYFSRVDPTDGVAHLLSAVESRARLHPLPYGHWYVDGGEAVSPSHSLACISYGALAPARKALLRRVQEEVSKPGMGPEELRNALALLSPGELGLRGDPVLDRFQVRLLTEGSGTQIFSTTFVQWTTRELLRRAAAVSLLVRFAPRQRQRPLNELLANSDEHVELDPLGSLVDADMAAYYHWINQQRLPGAKQSSFLVWFEGHHQAIAIGPTMPRGAESRSDLDLERLLVLATEAS